MSSLSLTHTNIFLSPLGKPLSSFSLHSVQITSRWDKSIMFPKNLFPHFTSLFRPHVSPPFSCALCPKRTHSFHGGLGGAVQGGQKGKQNLCNQQQVTHTTTMSQSVPHPRNHIINTNPHLGTQNSSLPTQTQHLGSSGIQAVA